MKIVVSVDGLKELDRALGELPKSTAKGVLLRVLRKAGQPIADAAKGFVAKDTGELRDSIQVSSKFDNKVGKAEFAAAMKAGLGRVAAGEALRNARRKAIGESFAMVFVGPSKAKSKKDGIKRYVNEYGSVKMAANPYMRPAWDANKNNALTIIKSDLGAEIRETANRAARRKVAKLARGG